MDLEAILALSEEDETFEAVDGYETNGYDDDYGPITIRNRSIDSLKDQISVAGDRNSQYILFETERYQDNIDLASKKISIHYELDTDDGCKGNSDATNVKASSEHLRFGWLIPPDATEQAGILKVMPFAYLSENENYPYVLKDLYIEYTIYPGLDI